MLKNKQFLVNQQQSFAQEGTAVDLVLDLCLILALGFVPVVGFHILMRLLQGIARDGGLIPARHCLIPGTNQHFLYIEDFHTMTWGDCLGLSGVWAASLYAVMTGWKGNMLEGTAILAGGLVVGVVAAVSFHKMCLGTDHKPDYGFPAMGVSSTAGKVHTVFFGLSFWVGFAGIGFIIAFQDQIGHSTDITMLTCGWCIGLGIWLVASFADIIVGNFEPLRLLPKTCPKCGGVQASGGVECLACGTHI